MDVPHTKYITSELAYHFLWYPEYRKKTLVGKIATLLEQELRRTSAENAWSFEAVNIQSDHVQS